MALHWKLASVNLDDERTAWKRDGAKYRTPLACVPAYMKKGGAGHFAFGIWPPTDIPVEVWNVVDLYQTCGFGPETPGFLPSQIDGEDAWTMDAFRVLQAAESHIRYAMMKKETESK
ncbi:hypothetical protein HN371_08560 [Candidatus Poribacteria bacterium]|nr:hypothetical protein [Candidatus Poribacteria bacterium]MBT7098071.1 hypothetical protein [Candidatus Poribacteria bacterium]